MSCATYTIYSVCLGESVRKSYTNYSKSPKTHLRAAPQNYYMAIMCPKVKDQTARHTHTLRVLQPAVKLSRISESELSLLHKPEMYNLVWRRQVYVFNIINYVYIRAIIYQIALSKWYKSTTLQRTIQISQQIYGASLPSAHICLINVWCATWSIIRCCCSSSALLFALRMYTYIYIFMHIYVRVRRVYNHRVLPSWAQFSFICLFAFVKCT